uniref:Uncharacterized protein n=1 Tax=Mycena chlorophos TaxID=658473 RepID=A0ABQ0KZF0_MYCCL|nr:predicted protein [Mycena chlorophos]
MSRRAWSQRFRLTIEHGIEVAIFAAANYALWSSGPPASPPAAPAPTANDEHELERNANPLPHGMVLHRPQRPSTGGVGLQMGIPLGSTLNNGERLAALLATRNNQLTRVVRLAQLYLPRPLTNYQRVQQINDNHSPSATTASSVATTPASSDYVLASTSDALPAVFVVADNGAEDAVMHPSRAAGVVLAIVLEPVNVAEHVPRSGVYDLLLRAYILRTQGPVAPTVWILTVDENEFNAAAQSNQLTVSMAGPPDPSLTGIPVHDQAGPEAASNPVLTVEGDFYVGIEHRRGSQSPSLGERRSGSASPRQVGTREPVSDAGPSTSTGAQPAAPSTVDGEASDSSTGNGTQGRHRGCTHRRKGIGRR